MNKAREEYNAQLQKGIEIGLERAARPSLCEGQKKTHMTLKARKRSVHAFGKNMVHATVPKRSVDPNFKSI